MSARAMTAAAAIAAVAVLAGPVAAQEAPAGRAVYDRWCAGCHGEDGAGEGSAADRMLPRPRDFTVARYQIRSTASGELPTDADLLKVIDEGMPGTAMPGWRKALPESDRRALVEYVKSFSPFFEREGAPEPVELSGPPGVSEEGLAEGKEFYDRIECWKCHGRAGRGDGPSAPTLEDDAGRPVVARDLTQGWLFDGGGSVEEIHRRLVTGLDGTPMPANAELIEAGFMTEEQLWRVSQYVRSLSPEKPPEVREVVRARRVESLPAGVDDDAWARVERYWIPLVGQVIVEPRWFAPRVVGVWVQALHDDERLAVRLTWHDPSESPDPAWTEWRERVLAIMLAGEESEAAAEDDATGSPAAPGTDAEALAVEAAPDALVVQFPRQIPEGSERPYFLMGSDREPVYVWRWRSDGDGARESLARGLARYEPLAGAEGALEAEAVFDEGEWRLLVERPLAAGGVEQRPTFETGRPLPFALFAWDGDNGESETRGAIGTWYFLYLDEPVGSEVYVVPLAATLLTALLGVVVVARARRSAGGGSSDA